MQRIETERLLIRAFRHQDLEPFAEMVGDPEVMRLIGSGQTLTFEEARRRVQGYIRQHQALGYSRFAVTLRESGRFIGFCGVVPWQGQLDFGWRFLKPFWGRGFATESARAVMGHALFVLNLPELVALAFVENAASVAVMQKIGMDFDGYDRVFGKLVVRYVKSPSPASGRQGEARKWFP